MSRKQPKEANIRQDSFSDGFVVLNTVLAYSFQQEGLAGFDIELNIKNLFNKSYRNQDLVIHDGRFDEQGNEIEFDAWIDGRYDERSIDFSIRYHW